MNTEYVKEQKVMKLKGRTGSYIAAERGIFPRLQLSKDHIPGSSRAVIACEHLQECARPILYFDVLCEEIEGVDGMLQIFPSELGIDQ